jgi:hypothetical protein
MHKCQGIRTILRPGVKTWFRVRPAGGCFDASAKLRQLRHLRVKISQVLPLHYASGCNLDRINCSGWLASG